MLLQGTWADGDSRQLPPTIFFDRLGEFDEETEEKAAAAVAWHAKPEERDRLIRVIATEAAIRRDAHLSEEREAEHDLQHIEKLCDEVIWLWDGCVAAQGAPTVVCCQVQD